MEWKVVRARYSGVDYRPIGTECEEDGGMVDADLRV